MKYLKAYAKICLRHSEKDCDGCPFSSARTGSDSCLRYILENPEDSQNRILSYVKAVKEEAKRKELEAFWKKKREGEESRDAYMD